MSEESVTSDGNTVPRSGYDVPVYGLDDGSFYYIHIPALVCIVASFCCASVSVTLAFNQWSRSNFFVSWTKSQRFVVYLAICDGLFNLSHFMDHLHIAIVREMVRPKELCQFYGFNLTVFITSQNLIVNLIAINGFVLLYYGRTISFGNKDWKFILLTYGATFVGSLVAGVTGQYGPNGA